MNPLSIRAANYRTFDELDLTLPAGCVAILGENGAGKSSIVNLIDLALFGPESRTLADSLSDDVVEENLLLELTFEHNDRLFKVRRTYSPRGRGQTKVDFEVLDETTLTSVPLTRETAAATQEAIEQTIGLTRETFRASAFLAQGDGAAFTEAQPRDRKRILADVLGLNVWERLLEFARRDRRAGELELAAVTGQIDQAGMALAESATINDEVATAKRAGVTAAKGVLEDETILAGVQEQLNRARAIAAARDSAERAVTAAGRAHGQAVEQESLLQADLAALTERLQERAALARDSESLPALVEERDGLQQRIQASEERARLVIERNRLLGEASERNEKAHALREQADQVLASAGDATCDRCGQTLGRDAAGRAATSYREDADALDRAATDLDLQAGQLTETIDALPAETPDRDRIAVLHDLIQKAQHAREKLAALDEAAARRSQVEAQLAAVREGLPDLARAAGEAQEQLRALLAGDGGRPVAELEEEARDIAAAIAGWRNAVTETERTLARLEERLARLDKVAADLKTNEERRDQLHGDLDLLHTLERAYGRDGIPALIVENAAIPQLEVEASRILAELGTPYRVELRTERALKSGEGTRDTLDVIVVGDSGERPYETFSGGERTRINLALRIALARLLAHRRGAESRLLVIDEPEFLDEPGVARLADVLRGLAGDFDRIYLVSHVPGLRDAFDETLAVVKDDGRSRVETGTPAEPVPA